MEKDKKRAYGDVLTISDVCSILNISRKTAYRLIAGRGGSKLPAKKIGRQYRVLKRDLFALFSQG